jgi:hypothetical protein
MKYKLLNEWMSHEFGIFFKIYVLNVFSIHDISVWNVRIMNEWILHDFHF